MPKARKEKVEKKLAKKKDKNAPKRPLSAFMFFSKDRRETVRTDNPDASFGEIGKLLGENWRSLSDGDKTPYNAQAADDKKRYEKEIANYNEQNHNDTDGAEDDD